VGITAIEGDFERGDLVQISCGTVVLGVGVAQYGSESARQWLGQKGKRPLVHYDYMYLS
jgi:glutamate 5-kinase